MQSDEPIRTLLTHCRKKRDKAQRMVSRMTEWRGSDTPVNYSPEAWDAEIEGDIASAIRRAEKWSQWCEAIGELLERAGQPQPDLGSHTTPPGGRCPALRCGAGWPGEPEETITKQAT